MVERGLAWVIFALALLIAPVYGCLLIDTYRSIVRDIRVWRRRREGGGGAADFPCY